MSAVSTGHRGPADHDSLRIRLEGGAEVLELASVHYRAMTQRLSRPGWKRWLRANPDAIPQLLREEAAVAAALARLDQVATIEGWSLEEGPGAQLAGARRLREELQRWVRRRLRRFTTPPPGELAQELSQLHALATPAPPGEPLPDERVALFTGPTLPPTLLITMISAYALSILLGAMLASEATAAIAPAVVLLGVASVLRSGRLWITNRRIIWKPTFGEAAEVAISKVRSVKASRWMRSVEIEGDRALRVQQIAQFDEAHLLLRLAEAGGAALLAAPPRTELVLIPVWRGYAEERRNPTQYLILSHDWLAHMPAKAGGSLLSALTQGDGKAPPHGGVPGLVKVLEALSSAEAREALARTDGARVWPNGDMKRLRDTPVWNDMAFSDGASTFAGKVDWRQQDVAERIVRSWPVPLATVPGR